MAAAQEAKKVEAEAELAAIKAQKKFVAEAAVVAEAHHHEVSRKRKLFSQLSESEDPAPVTSPGERAAFHRIFDEIDRNFDGQISFSELHSYVNNKLKLGVAGEELEKMFFEADTDADDVITFAEFVRVIKSAAAFKASAAWKKVQEELRREIDRHDEKHADNVSGFAPAPTAKKAKSPPKKTKK